jgi:WD40 repeat protein
MAEKAPPASPTSAQPPSPPKANPKLTYVASQWAHTSPLISCRFDPKGRFVLAGAQDCTIQRWKLSDGKKLAPLAGHESWVRAIGFLPDGETTLTGGYDGRLIWWPTAAEKSDQIRKIDAHTGWLRCVSVSPDGRRIATGGNDNLVKLWNAADGKLICDLSGHGSHVYSVLFHSDGKSLLSGELMGKVHQWEVESGKLLRTFDAADLHTYNDGQKTNYGGVRSMALSGDGKYLACAGLYKASNPLGAVQDPLVLLFDWQSQKKVQSHTAAGDLKGIIWRAVYHKDNYLIGGSGGSGGGFALFWKPDQANEFHRFALPNTILDLDLHPDGLQLATAHHDRNLRLSRMTAKPA